MLKKRFFEFIEITSPLKFSIETILIRNFAKLRGFSKKFRENLETIFFYFINNFSLYTKKSVFMRLLIGYHFKIRIKYFIQRPIISKIYELIIFNYIQVLNLYLINKQFFKKKCFKKFLNFNMVSRQKYESCLRWFFIKKFKLFGIIKNKLNQIFLEKYLNENVPSIKIKIIFKFQRKKNLASKIQYLEFTNKKQKISLYLKNKQRKYLLIKEFFFSVKNLYRKIVDVDFFFRGFYKKLKFYVNTRTLLFLSFKKKNFKYNNPRKIFVYCMELFYPICYTKTIEILVFFSGNGFFDFLNLNFFRLIKFFLLNSTKPEFFNHMNFKIPPPKIILDFLFHSNSSKPRINNNIKEFNCYLRFSKLKVFQKILKKTNSFFNLFRLNIKFIEILKNFSRTKNILYYFPNIETMFGTFTRQMIIKLFQENYFCSLFWKKLQTNFYSGYIIETFKFNNQYARKIDCEKRKSFSFWQKTLFSIMNYFAAVGIENFSGGFNPIFLNYLLEKKNKNIFFIFKINFLQVFIEKNFLDFFFLKKILYCRRILKSIKSRLWLFYENFVIKKSSKILFFRLRVSVLLIYKNILCSDNFF